MENNGYILLHRKFMNWEWYDDINCKTLFIHLLLNANHKDNSWQGIEIKRGELITSTEKLHKQTLLTIKQVRIALNKLKATNEITIKTTNKYSLLVINNYNTYQDMSLFLGKQNGEQKDNPGANKGQTKGKQRATNKEYKECKEYKEDIYIDNSNLKSKKENRIPTEIEVIEYIREKGFPIDAAKFYNFYEAKGWMLGKNPIKNWKACVQTWLRNDNGTEYKPEKKEITDEQFKKLLTIRRVD